MTDLEKQRRYQAGRKFAEQENASLAGMATAPNVPDDIDPNDADFHRGYDDYFRERERGPAA